MSRTIAQIQVEGIQAGKTTQEILAEVKAEHGAAVKTSKYCVAWYRNHLKKGDPRVTKWLKADPEAQAALDEEFGQPAPYITDPAAVAPRTGRAK